MPEEVLNRETVNRLYTGGTQEQLSGLVHLDARHYSPAKTKFVQPDPYSLTELSLPEEARHTLVKAAGLTLEGLLADPAQQLSNSYVSNNPLKWTDPLGLFDFGVTIEGRFGTTRRRARLFRRHRDRHGQSLGIWLFLLFGKSRGNELRIRNRSFRKYGRRRRGSLQC